MFRERTKNTVEFENAKTDAHEVHYTRYIVSWVKEYLKLYQEERVSLQDHPVHRARGVHGIFGSEFKDWLRSLDLTEDEIDDIYLIATNGKMELEASALMYIKEHH